MKKRIIPFLLTLCLTAALLPGAAAEAAEYSGPAVSVNAYANSYNFWPTESVPPNYRWHQAANSIYSYLYENDSGGLTRVEPISGHIAVEEYDSSFQFLSGRVIPFELDIWGGFFAGEDYNFFIFGQSNPTERNDVEVIRVVKYSKDWQRLGQASLYGINTVDPFDAGSLRCAEYGGTLFIHTSHTMYKWDDGINHQANLNISVRESDMKVLSTNHTIQNLNTGYVSHSFNQFVLIDQERNIVTLDHGDANPRSAVLVVYDRKADDGIFKWDRMVKYVEIQKFSSYSGNIWTGASLGGLAETTGGYVLAYNYDGKGTGKNPADRSVYFAYVDKETLSVKTQKISDAGTLTPVLAPTGLDGGYILWNASNENGTGNNTLYYARYSADGTVGPVKTDTGRLSDCQPIVYDGKLVWYTTGAVGRRASAKTVPTFYQLDENGLTATKLGPDLTGTCGDNLTWTIYDLDTGLHPGLLEIEGTGPMSSYSNSTMTGAHNPWFAFRYDLKNVTIGSGVTSIGDHAFYDSDSLTGVTIPSSVTSIGTGAFRACVSLPGVTLPGSITSIGDNAFMGCTSLTSVNIPNKVTRIGDGAFNSCPSLTGVILPNSLISIGNEAFRACFGLTGTMTIPDSVTSIGDNAFYYCSNLKSVTLGKGVAKLGHYAFRFCSNLTDVSIHSDITDTGYGIFEGCGKLTMTFGDGVTTIKQGLFTGDSSALTRVIIGDSVTTIGTEAFKDCKNLTGVTIGSGVTSIGQNAFLNTPWLKNQGEFAIVNGILFAYQGSGEAVIPSGVTQIAPYAFYNCDALTGVTIPVSVVKVGDHAFWWCSGLSRVHYEGTDAMWNAITIEIGNDRLIYAVRSYGNANPTGKPLTKDMFTVDTAGETYDGKAKTKTVTGKDAGAALTAGKDYTVTYAGNTNAGTATLTIKGQGSYTGTLTYNFTISKAERVLIAVLNPAQLRLNGSAGEIALTDNAAGDSPSYTYTSGDTSVATVSGGAVTPVSVGTTTVAVDAPETANYKAGSATVNVTVTVVPTQDLRFAASSMVKTWEDPDFTNAAVNHSEGGGRVTYTSSRIDVAYVDSRSGQVTLISPGTATITAKAAAVPGVWAETSVSYMLIVSDPKDAYKPGGFTAPTTPPAGRVMLSPQNLTVDGKAAACEKYNIDDRNYFKLRDLASLLSGTGSQFEVGYDAATATVSITTGQAYTPAGTELAEGVDNSASTQPSSQTILINGEKHGELTVYNIGGSNFFQLRELGAMLGFEVDFDQNTNTAIVLSAQR